MSVTMSERRRELINEIAVREGFEKYEVDFSQGSLKGDGYTGTITLVKISDLAKEKVLYLVLKAAHSLHEASKIMVDSIYQRENYIYDVIFKDFIALQEEYGVLPPFIETAHYYGGLIEKNEECVVLENLIKAGFKLWNRKVAMDSHHVGAVMARYGKHHALSYAMKILQPKIYAERTKNLSNPFEKSIDEDFIKKMVSSVIDKAVDTLDGNTVLISALKKFEDIWQEFFMVEVKNVDEKYKAILHGDCWSNNMMFKYENTELQKPSQVYLLDWQLSLVGLPIMDLTYFFYCCSSKECLDNYGTYLKIYHDSLSEMLQKFGISSNDIMTYEELKALWKKFAKNGIYKAVTIIKVMLTEQEEVYDVREMGKESDMINFLTNDISNNEEYKRRLSIVIDHMLKNGFI